MAISYLPAEELNAQEEIRLIRAEGCKGVALLGDIRSEQFCQQLVSSAVQQLGGLDILVNNAGREHSHDLILDVSTEQFDWTPKTNIYATFWITKAAIPHLPPGAAIINTSSVNAFNPSANLLDYAMTQCVIAYFTKELAQQMVDRGVRVDTVAHGPFRTVLKVIRRPND